MPNNNNRINFQVGYNVDQASVNAVKKSLQDLQNIKFKDFNGPKKDLDDIKQKASQVEAALNKAFNVNLNSLNTQAFNAELQKAGLNIDKIYTSFSKAGAQGQVAFSRMASEVLTTNMQLKQTNSLVSQMGETMANTVKWGIASSVMNNFTNSVRQAFDYVKALDSSLNDIRIVTKQSSEQMANFAVQANNSAQALGRSTMDYTKAALTFYQQGLDEASVQARTESVLKAQNITGAGEEMADYLTAVWNGYKVANEEAELYVDKLAAVADSSASNMSQLAIAMSKVASSANLLGVPVDNLNAQIATIVATTRQAPESVGNALKTIYSRINDIATGADDAQISLGNYSAKMAQVGINVLDANGRLRDTGDVIDEIGGKWETLSHEQQIYLARTMAGQRQYNNLLALFENWGKYSDLVNVSMEAQGATAQKNAIYMESLSAKMEQLGAAGEKVKSALIEEEDLKGLVDFGTGAVNLFGNLIQSIGGGKGALLTFGSIFTQVFSGTIAKEINNAIVNAQNYRHNLDQINNAINKANQSGENSFARGITTEYVQNLQQMQKYWSVLSNEQKQEQQNRANQINTLRQQQAVLKENTAQAKAFYQAMSGKNLQTSTETRIDRQLKNAKNSLEDLKQAYESFLNNANIPNKIDLVGIQQLQNSKIALGQLRDAVKNVIQTTNSTSPQDSRLLRVLDSLAEKGKVDQEVLNRVIEQVERLQDKTGKNILNLENYSQNTQQLNQAQERIKNLQKQFDAINKGARQAFDTKAVVNFAAGLGQVASGINSIKNLGSIWSRDDLSTGQKMVQTMTNIGMTIPMLVNGLKLMKTSWGGVTDSIKLAAAQILVRNGQIIAADAGATAAQMSLATAIRTVTASILASPLAPFIAIAAAVGVAIYGVYKQWNRENEAAQKAAKTAQETKKTYDDLKSSYDNLKSSLEDYNSAQNAIAEMTKGTQEWRDAIRESNDAVLQLIQNYPQLATQVQNVNGQLKISKSVQEEALANMGNAVDNARLASVAATANSRDASLAAKARQSSRFIGVSTQTSQDIMGGYNTIMATTDQVVSVIQAYSDNFSTNTQQMIQAISKETGISQEMVAAIVNGTDNIKALSDEYIANTQATKLAYEAIASERLQENSIYKTFDELGKQVADTIAGQDLQKVEKERIDHWMEYLTKGINQNSFNSNEQVQYMLAELNRVQQTNWGLAKNAVQGNDANRTFDFITQTGQVVKWTAQQVAATIAAADALQSLTGSAQKASDVLADIQGLSGSNSKGMKGFIANEGFGNLTKKELEGINLSQLNDFFAEYWDDLAYDSQNDFRNSFSQALEASKNDWNLIGSKGLKPVQESLNKMFAAKDFTQDTARNIETALGAAFKQVGSSGVVALGGELLRTSDNVDQLAKILASGDLSTPEGLEELQIALQAVGDGSFAASDEWKRFVNEVNQSQFINPLDSIFQREGNIQNITKDIKKYSIVSEQDYNTLLEINPQIDAMFTRVAQGYQFIGQKGSLMDLITGGTNGYFKAADQFDSLKEGAENIAESFGQNFSANLMKEIDLPRIFTNTINTINNQEASDKLWSALGFNQEYIQAKYQRYNQLFDTIIEKRNRGQDFSEENSEYKQVLAELYDFIASAAGVQDSINGISDSLRDAGALGLETISQLNDALKSGALGQDQQLAIQRYNNALQKVSDTEMENLGFDVDQYQNFVKILQDTNEEMQNNQYLARQMAKANMRISKGMDDLRDNFEEWNDALLDFQEYGDVSRLADSWNQIRQTMANLFDSDAQAIDMLGPDFVANNIDKIQAVKDGVDGAYEQLSNLMNQELILKAYGVSDFSQLDQDVQDAYNKIQEVSNDATIQVGAVFSGQDDLIDAFNRIVQNANWTSDQAQAAFANMGYDVEIEADDPDMLQDSQSTQFYVPPTYRMVPKKWDFGPFGSGTMLLPELAVGGHYQSSGGGTKQTYKPGAYAIKTVTKNGKGSGGNISRGNAGSAKPRGGKGGGGGGGGGKKPTPAAQAKISTAKIDTKSKTSDYNPYQQEEKSYDRQSKILDALQDKQKKLVNKDRLKNLQEQNKTLEKQKDILQKELAISANAAAENSTANYANRLKQAFKDIGFDSDGQIADINKIQAENAKVYNQAAQAAADAFEKEKQEYNNYIQNVWNKYADKEQQEAHKGEKDLWDERVKNAQKAANDSIKAAEDVYKEREDLIKSYNDAWKEDQERLKEYNELTDQIYDNLIAISKIKVDLSIDTGDFERDWLDFENKFIKKLDKDDFLGSAKASAKELMSYFNSNQVQQTANQIKKIRDEIAIMNAGAVSSIYGTNLAQAKEDLEDYMEQQMKDLQEVQDMVDNIKDNYLDAIDDAKDKMDEQIDQYERVNDLIDHNVKMVELLYGDKAYDSMQKYYNLQKSNNERELESLKKQQDYWQKKMNNQVVGSDAWEKFKKNLDDVTDNLNDKLEDMIDNLANQFENRVNGIIARLNNTLTGGRGLDFLDEQWDYISNYDDNFLDTFETKTGIEEVERLYQSQIDNLVGSPKSQQKLNKLMNDQLKLLREKDHLTEYDLERAKASLEVEKARLALEEARDRKTKMRLRRDSQGNYTYQYVADEQKLGDLQAALADAQANLYNTDKQHYKQNLNTLYDTYKDYIEKMRDLTAEYNATQDEEERKRIQGRIDLLKESTAKLMSGLTEDNKYLLNYLNGSFFDGMGTDTSTLTMEEQMEIMKENIPYMQSQIQDLSDTIVGEGGILPATANMMEQINKATADYDQNVKNMLTAAGTSLQTIEQAVDKEGNALDKNIINAEKLITTNDELIKSCQAQIEAMEKLLDYMDKYLNKVMNVQTLLSNLRSAYNTGQDLNGSNLTADNIGMESWGLDTTSGMEYTGNPKTDAAAIKQQIDALMAQYEKFLSAMTIATFDTGGYTGTWGDAEGRLAFLHSGELVLNQDDTMNILNAVQIVRSMASAINSIASGEINSLMNGASGLLGGINNTEQLDQNVHIEANFPNVTQHTQIEQAFENLVNMASMRASRYRD